jgi:CubicO group peptidase (beta-lactamase class C family)
MVRANRRKGTWMTPFPRRRLLAAGTTAAALLVAGGRPSTRLLAQTPRMPLAFPPLEGDDWPTATAADAGWNAGRLDDALTFAGDRNSTAVIILWRGRIIAERYWRGWDRHTAASVASVQKSVVSLLAGIAIEREHVRIDDPVSRHLGAGWSKAPADAEVRITIRNLLTMTSGLNDDLTLAAEPGIVWYYNTPAYYRVKSVLEITTGLTMNELTRAWLSERIGWQDSSWLGASAIGPPPEGQLRSSARDLARFGLLVLAGGRWDGQPVLADTAYLAASLNPSQTLNPAYGYLWWLNGTDRFLLPGPRARGGEGPLIPTAPADLVAALGAAGPRPRSARSMRSCGSGCRPPHRVASRVGVVPAQRATIDRK